MYVFVLGSSGRLLYRQAHMRLPELVGMGVRLSFQQNGKWGAREIVIAAFYNYIL